MSKRKLKRKRSQRKSNLSDLTGKRFDRYKEFVSHLEKKFSTNSLPTEWLINLSVFLQEVDESILGNLILRITNEQESLNEMGTGEYIGYHCDQDDYCFVWVEMPN